MRDGLAAGHLGLGALDIDVDPLEIPGRLGEQIDLLLADVDPLADADLVADQRPHFIETCYRAHGARAFHF